MAKGNYDDPIFYTVSDGVNTSYSFNSGVVDGTTQRVVHATDVGLSASASQSGAWAVTLVEGAQASVNVTNSSFPVTQSGAWAVSLVEGSQASVSALQAGAWAVNLVEGAQASVSALQAGSWAVSLVEGAQVSASVLVADIFATTAASNVVNADNRVKTALTGTITVDGSAVTQPISAGASLTVDQLSGANWSVTASLVANSSVNVNGALNSMVAVGPTLHDAVYAGDAPQIVGGVAMTANPTAVVGGDVSRFLSDKIGRQLIYPVQVRELLATAYISKATGVTFGTETTLLAGVASTFLDLIALTATNNSTVAIIADIRDGTLGGIVLSIGIPAASSAQFNFTPPIPQNAVAQTWTVDLPDVTGTTCTFSALFAKNI